MASQFDQVAADYDRQIAEGLSATGESKDYFAEGRVRWLEGCLSRSAAFAAPRSILDYGCGTGSTIPLLKALAAGASITGVDVSAESLRVAERTQAGPGVRFATVADEVPKGNVDLAYCNGIFHHIPPVERLTAARYVFDSLAPGGLFAFWENNPWNPGTRWVMSRIPFDRDAIPLSVIEARRLLRGAGFRLIRTDFLFVFPRALKPLRFLEPQMARLPLGAQYQILCQKA